VQRRRLQVRLPGRRTIAALLGVGGPLAVLAFMTLGGASCDDPVKTATPDTGTPIRFGASLALSGDSQAYGATLQNAIRVAEQQINAHGGVLGRRVEYKVVDDTSDTDVVLKRNITGLLDEGVLAILGPIGSQQVQAAAPLTAARKVMLISGSATSVELSTFQPANDRWFFRTLPNDSLQGKALAIFARRGPGGGADAGVPDSSVPDTSTVSDAGSEAGDAAPDAAKADAAVPPGPVKGCSKMAILHFDDSYGNPFARSTTEEFAKLGGAVVADIPIPGELKANYATEVGRVMSAKPECLVLIVFDPHGDEFLRELKEARVGLPNALPPGFFIAGTDGVYTPDFIINGRLNKAEATSPTIAEGVYGTNPDPAPESTQYGDFRNLYLAQFAFQNGETELGSNVANYYDAAILAALAVQRAGSSTDTVKIRDSLLEVSRPGGKAFGPAQVGEALQALRNGQDIDYTGAGGPVDLDQNGDVISDYIIWKVQNGQFQTIERIKSDELGK
jgi:ABC-type branched-subunit amino acid transport system substrate-binding protein